MESPAHYAERAQIFRELITGLPKKELLEKVALVLVQHGYNSILRDNFDGIRFDLNLVDDDTLQKITNSIRSLGVRSNAGMFH